MPPYQPALLTAPSPEAELFDRSLLRQHIEMLFSRSHPDENAIKSALKGWRQLVQAQLEDQSRLHPRVRRLTESNLEQSFNTFILGDVFGYKLPGGTSASYTIRPKDSGSTGIPDATLGFFGPDIDEPRVLVELKSLNADLDTPQSRISRETPVEQAFRTANSISTIRWIIVSNMDELRVYGKTHSGRYVRFRLSELYSTVTDTLAANWKAAFAIIHESQLLGSNQGAESSIDGLLQQTGLSSSALRGGFYDLFRQARSDLFQAIVSARQADTAEARLESLLKAQKLLDRTIFIRFCEDHPSSLLPRGRLERVITQAPQLPGRSTHKTYDAVKGYFEEIREGSASGAPYEVFAFDGELFALDDIIDTVQLDDTLFQKRYSASIGARRRTMTGPLGFWEFNFAQELNEHMLGHIYESSLADLEKGEVYAVQPAAAPENENLRAKYGVWYTPETLTDYLASVSLDPFLDRLYEEHVLSSPSESSIAQQVTHLMAYRNAIGNLRILDPACGSGAFLVSCFERLAAAHRSAANAIAKLQGLDQPSLFANIDRFILRKCLFGIDLSPEATAITKLALWLKTARPDEQNIDLSANIVTANSLSGVRQFTGVDFDVVIGNPPWGAVWTRSEREEYRERFRFEREEFRSEEAFIRLSERYLKRGGSLAFVLPDTILMPEKHETRKYLLDKWSLLRLNQLGPEWFSSENRMSTLVLHALRAVPSDMHTFSSFTLVDKDRKLAIAERFSLFQAEAMYAQPIRQRRCIEDGRDGYEIRLFQYESDLSIMATMASGAVPLFSNDSLGSNGICSRARGVELNRDGIVLACPSCGVFMPPPRFVNGAHRPKTCPSCGYRFAFNNATTRIIVRDGTPSGSNQALYVDGDSIHRYSALRFRTIDLDAGGIDYHSEEQYRGPKILVRQAGVGLNVVLDTTGAYVPQSVYIYKVTPAMQASGYSNSFVVGLLSSRIMHYYLFKRFGEIDSARAHVKVTHERLADMPVPRLVEATDAKHASEIAERVERIFADTNSSENLRLDLEIEERVQKLFRLTPSERAYMNGQFGIVHQNETVKALFPHGVPRPQPLRIDPALPL